MMPALVAEMRGASVKTAIETITRIDVTVTTGMLEMQEISSLSLEMRKTRESKVAIGRRGGGLVMRVVLRETDMAAALIAIESAIGLPVTNVEMDQSQGDLATNLRGVIQVHLATTEHLPKDPEQRQLRVLLLSRMLPLQLTSGVVSTGTIQHHHRPHRPMILRITVTLGAADTRIAEIRQVVLLCALRVRAQQSPLLGLT